MVKHTEQNRRYFRDRKSGHLWRITGEDSTECWSFGKGKWDRCAHTLAYLYRNFDIMPLTEDQFPRP